MQTVVQFTLAFEVDFKMPVDEQAFKRAVRQHLIDELTSQGAELAERFPIKAFQID